MLVRICIKVWDPNGNPKKGPCEAWKTVTIDYPPVTGGPLVLKDHGILRGTNFVQVDEPSRQDAPYTGTIYASFDHIRHMIQKHDWLEAEAEALAA